MNDYIALSTLNDFIFCPYSIYLHGVYMDKDEGIYHATPQTGGKIAHEGIEKKTGSTRRADIMDLPVYSDELGICGKIDIYKQDRRLLIERKNNLKQIFRGQIYQLWGQYFCMKEMGYAIDHLAFYEISTNKMISVSLPRTEGKDELIHFIQQFRDYNPMLTQFIPNSNKCRHCIYCNICDKTTTDNVYT